MMSLSQAASDMNAQLTGADATFSGISKDTRSLQAGELYFAIRGDNFDGHAFVAEARSAGAVAAVVDHPLDDDIPQLLVDDSILALGRLARAHRQQFKGHLIALTGSNGKTTVKEMCRHVLAEIAGEGRVLATAGNLNNNIGVPLTLMRLQDQHRYAVIEMGANHVGEIEVLTQIALPDVALVNNAGPAHLEGFGSLDNVAKGKAEIYHGLGEQGIAVINIDDKYAPMWLQQCEHLNCLLFSTHKQDADVYCVQSEAGTEIHYQDHIAELNLMVPGEHNLANAMAATSLLLAVGLNFNAVVQALNSFTNISGRLARINLANGALLIDDTYNANPASVRAAIDVLAQQKARTVLVLGDMAELGDDAVGLHAEIGNYARQQGVGSLYATGELARHAAEAFGEHGHYHADKAGIAPRLLENMHIDTVILAKGSRAMRMETVVEELVAGTKNNNNKPGLNQGGES